MIIEPFYIFITILLCFLWSYIETGFFLGFMLKRNLYDRTSDRSNHKTPTPRGGGAAVVDTITASLLILSYFFFDQLSIIWPILLGFVIISTVSFIDDFKPLGIGSRLIVQFLTVIMALATIFSNHSLGLSTPEYLIFFIIVSIAWVGFINIFNFMDGIDGISSVESCSIMFGIAILSFLLNLPESNIYYSMAISGAVLGFLCYNWHPAKIFLGDVGSVGLGYIIGWVLIELILQGYYISALILPLYYFMDSGITILKRIRNKERFWEPHSKHYYQIAVRAGLKHSWVATIILCVNINLIIAAIAAAYMPKYSYIIFLLAVVVVASNLAMFNRVARRQE